MAWAWCVQGVRLGSALWLWVCVAHYFFQAVV